MPFLFVGERPSRRAIAIGATWANGHLAAKQLHDALRGLNIDPAAHDYCNLWSLPDAGPQDAADEAAAIQGIWQAIEHGATVVGMGAVVCRVLVREDVPHLQLVHPAARGAIRKKERYQAHVGSVLMGVGGIRDGCW
jgi:hypothetical protein